MDYSEMNETALRTPFCKRKQLPNGTILDYILELKKLLHHSGYGGSLEIDLREMFVGGLKNNKVRAKFLTRGNWLMWKGVRDEAIQP